MLKGRNGTKRTLRLAWIIILYMMLGQIGVPVEGVALVMGIGPLVGMFISMCNCLGNVVITTTFAKSEKLLDVEKLIQQHRWSENDNMSEREPNGSEHT